MNEFLMIFRHVPTAQSAPSPEEIQASVKQWQDWIGGIAQQGKFVSTQQLSDNGKTIKGTEVISDGPYAEVKEIIGGFLLCKAESLEEALQMAKGCPVHAYGGSVEVRELMKLDF
ncbi:MAG: YciI family protein [Bacteroidota bacterium]